jgi:hypothetical protein
VESAEIHSKPLRQTARAIRRLLMRTCELDTAAMVMAWKYWLG